jgi:ankyrin repeat protein
VRLHRYECIDFLLKAGADPDADDDARQTPAAMAAKQGDARMVELLKGDRGTGLEVKADGAAGAAPKS